MVLKITNSFKPLSFDEMVRPLQMYKEAYDKVEEQYADLSTQTEMWRDIANQTNSPEAYEMFKRYADQLQAITDDFATGMTLQNRSQLMNMRRRYAAEIVPIQKAKEAYDKMVETREKISTADDSAMFLNQYTGIDDFLHGNTADNSYVSGNKVMARIAAKCEAYGKSEYGELKLKEAGISKGYQDIYSQQNGYSYSILEEALSENPTSDAAKDIRNIIYSELRNSGYESLSGVDKDRLLEYAQTGAYSGLAKPASQIVDSGKQAEQNYRLSRDKYNLEVQQFNEQVRQADRTYNEGVRQYEQNRKDNLFGTALQLGADPSQASVAIYGTDKTKEWGITPTSVANTNIAAAEKKTKKAIAEHGSVRSEYTLTQNNNVKRTRITCSDGTQFEVVYQKDQSGKWRPVNTNSVSNKQYTGNAQVESMPKIKGDLAGRFGAKILKDGTILDSNMNPEVVSVLMKRDKERTKSSLYQLGTIDDKGIYLGGGEHVALKEPKLMRFSQLKTENKEQYDAISRLFKNHGAGENPNNYYIWRDKNGEDFYFIDASRYPNGVGVYSTNGQSKKNRSGLIKQK